MNRTESQIRKKKGKSKVLRRFLLVVLLFFVILAGYGIYFAFNTIKAANESYSELERGDKSKLRNVAVDAGKDPISILLMGVEDYSSGGKNGRSDSLIVVTLNPHYQTMKLLSIPRDTRVYIEERGKKDKINHAYAYGGKEETIEAVESLLNIPIDYYATVNFKGFKNIIDEIGGITVNVPFDFWEKSDIDGRKIEFKEGKMHLNGEEALAYARMRKQDPRQDFGRNDRQRQIIIAAIDKMLKPENLLKIDDIAEHIGENIETNLKITEALAIQQKFGKFDTSKIDQLSLKGSDEYINGVYYFEPDEEELSLLTNELQNHLGNNIKLENETSQNP